MLFRGLITWFFVWYVAYANIAQTPPMGWLQWERYRCILDCVTYPKQCVTEELFTRMGKRLASDGYIDVGYEYINIDPECDYEGAPDCHRFARRSIDGKEGFLNRMVVEYLGEKSLNDCWSEKQRDRNGSLVPDRQRFPHGIKQLADTIHGFGLKLGIYTDMGTKTCAGYPAAMFHMKKDTELFASWGIDMIKLDGCFSCTDLFPDGHQTFGWYINQTNREILYSCEWPNYLDDTKPKPYSAVSKVCNIWRNWNDVQDSWQSVLSIIEYNGKHQDEIIPYVGPGHFNDMDMLLIGDYSLSEDQSKLQFAIWSIWSAPLFISADLESIKPWQKDILLNKEVIAVNQDKLGKMGRRVFKSDSQQTWFKPLADGSYAVVIMSLRQDNPVYMEAAFSLLNVTGPLHARDLYEQKDLGLFNTTFRAMVNPSGVVMVRLSKTV